MSNAAIYNINPIKFNLDPYPDLKAMRRDQPISFVPELGATLMTLREDIFINEKLINIFSSDQPNGLMTRLMGTNMMRKDGEAHKRERQATFKSFSPRTVKDVWKQSFVQATSNILDSLQDKNTADLVTEFAMPVSAEALKVVTGLENMNSKEMDRVSQGMIDGVSNYLGNTEIESNCQNCTASIDYHIDKILPKLKNNPDNSLISVQLEAGLSIDQLRANIKLAISGGQNEPRDAIAGTTCALLQNPEQLKRIIEHKNTWLEAFEEFGRWMSPIGMSPRRVINKYSYGEVEFYPEDKVFFMFGSANRDEAIFEDPEKFNVGRETSLSITFGAGPHFCAGAWISKVLIAEVALPMLFSRFPKLRLEEEVTFIGWAFRGLKSAQVSW
jgi:cytochrome P450